MNLANQKQLSQTINQGVLGIRQSEIDYYSNLCRVFGSQAALIGGFTYGNLAQNTFNTSGRYSETYRAIYYTLASATIGLSIHLILVTMLVQVYGPGLSINGPLGSMTRAAQGMKIESNEIIFVWLLLMLSFVLATVFLFYAVMKFWEALTATLIFVIAARFWYYYNERIYLRFYWDDDDNGGAWNPSDELVDGMEEPTIPTAFRKKEDSLKTTGGGSSNDVEKNTTSKKKKKMKGVDFFSYLFKTPFSEEQGKNSNNITSVSGGTAGNDNGEMNEDNQEIYDDHAGANMVIVTEGYLTIGSSSSSSEAKQTTQSMGSSATIEQWSRRYLILLPRGFMYIYKTRQSYRKDSTSPIYTRPLRLSEFYIRVTNEKKEDDKTLKTNVFQIALVPRENESFDEGTSFRNHWLLRCDTEEELHIWTQCLREVSPSCFNSSTSTSAGAAATTTTATATVFSLPSSVVMK
jgi:hypothetical protein